MRLSPIQNALIALTLIFLPFSSGCSVFDNAQNSAHALSEVQEAEAQYPKGQIDKAREWLHKAIDLSDTPKVYGVGDDVDSEGVIPVAIRFGDYEFVASLLGEAIKKPSFIKLPGAYIIYGDTLKRLGRIDEARAIFSQGASVLRNAHPNILDQDSDQKPVLFDVAYCEWEAGETDQAVADFNKAKDINPKTADFMANGLAYEEAESGVRLDEARKLAQSAVSNQEAANNDPIVLAMYEDTLGWVYYKRAVVLHETVKVNLDLALYNLQMAVADYPEESDIHVHLAKVYEARHELGDAAIEYARVASMHPVDPKAKLDVIRVPLPPDTSNPAAAK
jgi:tetratricopeptide (TPR) repeat protein